MRLKLLILLFGIALFGQAQKGTISGKILDKEMNNEPLPFANITVKGSKVGTTSNEKGEYTLNVSAGKVTVIYSFLGYKSQEVVLQVKEGKNIVHNQTLGSDSMMLGDVEVVTVKRKNTEAAMVMEMKEAKQVVSAISAEQMSKGTDGNAAEAIQRIPGIALIDGKYVIARGLSQRYNNVLINGSLAPSTEVNMRTFSFDLVPTSVLDKMVIYKTASADKPGDFAGGLIALTTSENQTEFTKINVGFGFRNQTSFKDQFHTQKSGTDWLGFDNGLRTLPNDFPSTQALQESAKTSGLRTSAAHSLENNFNPTGAKVFLNNSFGFGLGRKFNIGKVKAYTVNTLEYSTSFKTYERDFNETTGLQVNGENLPLKTDFNDDVYKDEVAINVMSNWIFTFNEFNKIKFKNLFNQIGENESNIRTGFNTLQRGNDLFKNYSFEYKSRSIYTGQLNGDHTLNETNKLDWVIGYNYVAENQPDLRRFRTVQAANQPNAAFTMIAPPSSNLFDTSRFFGNLQEFSANNSLNYTYTIKRETKDEELAPFEFKAGYLVDYKYRLYKSRYTSLLLPGYVSNARQQELIALPLTSVFSNENINQTNGWVLEEGTKRTDSYKADNFLTAGYLMANLPFKKWDVNLGVRVENNTQRLRYFNDANSYFKNDKTLLAILPSVNLGYNLNQKNVLRASYSRTVNRPEFRELSLNLFYDFKLNTNITGNQNLESSIIDNFDFRYEFYPTKSEMISIGGFYKKFKNPIENKILIAEQRTFSLGNADSAFNYGFEVEIKKTFKEYNIPVLEDMAVNVNYAYIVSEVDFGNQILAQDSKRALQGQSPYLINAALSYEKNNWSVNAIFNRIGDRIYAVADKNFPTIMEKSRNQLDFTIAKQFKKVKVKLGVQNILNAPFRLYDDTFADYEINTKKDLLTQSFREGVLVNLNFSYNF
ncbi:MAG: TonB-dependent receptor domain-containing protein [Flavobacterium sp.]